MSDNEEEKQSSHIENIETENLDEKRSSEILNPNTSPQKNEFMKNAYHAAPEEKKIENIEENMEKSRSATLPLSEDQKKGLESIAQQVIFARKKSHEEIIGEAYTERKKMSFNALKKWDEARQQFLITHRNFMDNIVIRLEKKMDFSKESLQKLLKFFKEKINHETEYCNFIKNKLPKIGEIFMETTVPKDSKHPPEKIMHYAEITSNLMLHDEIQGKNCKNQLLFIEFLEKTLCKELLGNFIQEFPKKLAKLKENMINLRKLLQKTNVEVLEKSMKHSKMFHAMIETNYQRPKKVKDLYNTQLAFLEKANQQVDLHRKLGKETLGYWHEILKVQCEVLALIQQAFASFLANQMRTYGVSNELEVTLKKFNEMECVKAAEEEFKIETIVSKEEALFIKKHLNGGKMDETKLKLLDLERFFEEFEIIKIKEKPLILKEILAERDVGGFSKKFVDCLIVFTVDRNILLFDENKEELPASFALKVENVNIKERVEKDVGYIEITEKLPGLLFNSKQNFLMRTKNHNSYEEFVDYTKLVAKKTG